MACSGCARRRRRLLTMAGRVMAAMGRPIPRRSLDAMSGVLCMNCGFKADGVGFGWLEDEERGYCPKCTSVNLTPGTARLTT